MQPEAGDSLSESGCRDGNWNDSNNRFKPAEICRIGGEERKFVSCCDAGDHQVSHTPAGLAAHGNHLSGDNPVLSGGLSIKGQRAEGRLDSLSSLSLSVIAIAI